MSAHSGKQKCKMYSKVLVQFQFVARKHFMTLPIAVQRTYVVYFTYHSVFANKLQAFYEQIGRKLYIMAVFITKNSDLVLKGTASL